MCAVSAAYVAFAIYPSLLRVFSLVPLGLLGRGLFVQNKCVCDAVVSQYLSRPRTWYVLTLHCAYHLPEAELDPRTDAREPQWVHTVL